MWCVYRHIAPNGKMYVGITSQSPDKRWMLGHGYRNNDYFSKAIAKYGWDNFKHEILLDNLSLSEASWAEEVLIAVWELTQRENGYNIRGGGMGNFRHSEETKRKMSASATGRKMSTESKAKMSKWRKGRKTWMKGRKHKAESKQKMSEAHKGKCISAQTRQKLSEANSGENHPMYGKKHTIESRRKMSKAHTGVPLTREAIINQSKPVAQYDKTTGELIQKFYGATEASRRTGVNKGNINACCGGHRKSAGGYIWRYTEETERKTI